MNSLANVFVLLLDITRLLVGLAFLATLLVALTHWLVRSQRIQPFGGWATFVRRWSDPLLRPIERRLHGAGGNPQHAPWWLLAVVVVGGLVLIELLRWLFGFVLSFGMAAGAGPQALLVMAVLTVIRLLMFLLLVRVFASWFGIGRYNKWMKIPYSATDWLVEPIRRVVPPLGMFDLSPLVAYLVLMVVRWLVLANL